MARYCPDCEDVLTPGASECPCGWTDNDKKAKSKRSSKPTPEPDCICQWSHEEKRCPMPAATKIDGQALCGGHRTTRYDHERSLEVFNFVNDQMDGNATRVHDVAVGCYKKALFWKKVGFQDVLCLNHGMLINLKKKTNAWFVEATGVIRELIENNWSDRFKL